ncbi:MAG: AbrB/MazE/SpoVT family DNA-binding domain-containing protein [Nocardioidaceae bacterium]
MKTTIDAAGRVVVPKHLRDLLGLKGGTEVEVGERDGAVEIRPMGREVVLSHGADGGAVLTAPAGTPQLTDDDVRLAIDDSRQWPRNR